MFTLLQSSAIATGQPVNWSHPVNRGLVSWWLVLPGAYGRAFQWRDLAGRNHGVLTNMAPGSDWVGPSGRPGGYGALDFDGSDDYVRVGNFPALDGDALTVSAWGRVTNTSDRNLFGKGNAAANSFFHDFIITADGGQWKLFMGDGVSALVVNAILTPRTVGIWNHLCLTLDNGVYAAYLDGSPIGSGVYPSRYRNSPNQDLYVGSRADGFAEWLGQMDDVRVYSRALSAPDVRELHLLSKAGYPGLLNRPGRALWMGAAAAAGGLLVHPGMAGGFKEMVGGLRG